MPTVYLDCVRGLYGGRINAVVHDGASTTQVAFRELTSNRPEAYAVVGCRKLRPWSQTRERAFRALVRASGKPFYDFTFRCDETSGRADQLAAWLARLPKRCAVFAVNDEVALETLAACRRIGKRVPADMTLVGVDNLERECESAVPSLTSVQVDSERAGYRAAAMLERLIAHGGHKLRDTYGPLMIVRRESSRGFGHRESSILAALDYIRREACNGLDAAGVVSRLHGSRRSVEKRFRATLGHSILDEIQNVRLERVFDLLAHSDKPIGVITSLCGYRSEIALRRLFLRRMGMSMRAWRQANGLSCQ